MKDFIIGILIVVTIIMGMSIFQIRDKLIHFEADLIVVENASLEMRGELETDDHRLYKLENNTQYLKDNYDKQLSFIVTSLKKMLDEDSYINSIAQAKNAK